MRIPVQIEVDGPNNWQCGKDCPFRDDGFCRLFAEDLVRLSPAGHDPVYARLLRCNDLDGDD